MGTVAVRNAAVALATAACMGVGATPALAQSVQFMGNTMGCFYSGSSVPTSCTGQSSTVGGLSYSGSTFNASSNSADGLFTLGNAPGGGVGGANFNNLGSFTLRDGNHNYTGQKFALFINFTQPTGARGENYYTAMLTGNLTNSTTGNVFVDFNNAAQRFTFSNGSSLSFSVNDLSLNDQTAGASGATVAVTGQGYAQAGTVPEPSSMALIGTGLVGLVPVFRRKRRD